MSKCLECGYYDKEKHYCPFYCQLIRETLDEAISFELENIKAEFEEIKGQRDNPYNNKTEYSVSMKELREVFDNHISELKGENNA